MVSAVDQSCASGGSRAFYITPRVSSHSLLLADTPVGFCRRSALWRGTCRIASDGRGRIGTPGETYISSYITSRARSSRYSRISMAVPASLARARVPARHASSRARIIPAACSEVPGARRDVVQGLTAGAQSTQTPVATAVAGLPSTRWDSADLLLGVMATCSRITLSAVVHSPRTGPAGPAADDLRRSQIPMTAHRACCAVQACRLSASS